MRTINLCLKPVLASLLALGNMAVLPKIYLNSILIIRCIINNHSIVRASFNFSSTGSY